MNTNAKDYKLNEIFITRSEIKRALWFARQRFPNCRAGQAFCNVYLKSKATWPELFYQEDQEKVIQMIHEYCTNTCTPRTFLITKDSK